MSDMSEMKKSVDLLTVDDIMLTKTQIELEMMRIPKGMKVSPAVYSKLHELLDTQDLTIQTFYGMKVIVDPDLKHGEWKFI